MLAFDPALRSGLASGRLPAGAYSFKIARFLHNIGELPIRRPNRAPPVAAKDGPRTNDEIRNAQIQLIDQDGTNHGTVETIAAIKMAAEAGMDLVEISPNNNPPVCKIMDYGKYKYSGAEEGRRSPQEAEDRRDQGDQAAADDRRSRLRREDAGDAAVLRGRRQGQDHPALSRPRNGAPGNRHQAARQGEGRRRRRTPRSSRTPGSKAVRSSWCWRRAEAAFIDVDGKPTPARQTSGGPVFVEPLQARLCEQGAAAGDLQEATSNCAVSSLSRCQFGQSSAISPIFVARLIKGCRGDDRAGCFRSGSSRALSTL